MDEPMSQADRYKLEAFEDSTVESRQLVLTHHDQEKVVDFAETLHGWVRVIVTDTHRQEIIWEKESTAS
jgi:hypothetical protein